MYNFTSSPNPNDLVKSGLAALQQGRAQDARRTFEQLFSMGHANASLWLAHGYACRSMGDKAAAHISADRSIGLEARNPRAYILKADLFREEGDDKAAAAYYRSALSAAPTQKPQDLVGELERAEKALNDLSHAFKHHVLQHIGTAPLGGNARLQEAVDLVLGDKPIYRSEPKSLFFPGLPDIAFDDTAADQDWVRELEAATPLIKAELEALIADQAGFGAYVTGSDNRPSFDSHGMVDNTSWGAFYLWRDGEAQSENMARCPETTAALNKIPLCRSGQRSPSVLFSKLEAGAVIPPHNGMVNTRLIGHLPLIIPENCGFRVGNHVRHWEEGKVWLFDDTVNHEAWNKSGHDRYILLFEIWRPELTLEEQQVVSQLFEAVDAY